MRLQEVILCSAAPSTSTSGTGAIALHDISTGSTLASFKQTSPAVQCTAVVNTTVLDGTPQGGLILTSQPDKSILNVYNFQKDQIALKIVLPEKLSCISVDARGEFCAGGTAQGRIYLWEIASGIMYNSWDAHYRQITVLRFTSDGAALLSGSEDSGVSVWSVSRLLDDELQNDPPSPYTTLSDHTLPITDIACGVGSFPSCRVLTSSVDHSVKLWDLYSKTLLTTFHFRHSISCLTWDVTERLFFAASSTSKGTVHQVNLFRKRNDHGSQNFGGMEAVGGAGVSDVIRIGEEDPREAKRRVITVGEPITSLTLSLTSSFLLTGTSTGQIHIHDIPSHQLLRTISSHKGFSITYLTTMLKPPDLIGHASLSLGTGSAGVGVGGGATSAGSGGAGGEIGVKPIMPFQRMKEPRARDAHEVVMVLPIRDKLSMSSLTSYSTAELLRDHEFFVNPIASPASSGPRAANPALLEPKVAELEDEVARLREQLGKAKRVNDVMWETVVKKVVKQGKDSDGDNAKDKDDGRAKKRGRVDTS